LLLLKNGRKLNNWNNCGWRYSCRKDKCYQKLFSKTVWRLGINLLWEL